MRTPGDWRLECGTITGAENAAKWLRRRSFRVRQQGSAVFVSKSYLGDMLRQAQRRYAAEDEGWRRCD